MLKSLIYPLANWLLLQPLGRVTRGMTLGVRGVVIDGEGRMLVVKQSYTHGWIFPGGGVERGETVLEALGRELHEEAGVRMNGRVQMHGLSPTMFTFRATMWRFTWCKIMWKSPGSRRWRYRRGRSCRRPRSGRTVRMR